MFGVWGHPDASRLTYFGLRALQHRGQEGAGIVTNNNGTMRGHRGAGLVSAVFKHDSQLEALPGDSAIGHVLYGQATSDTSDNIQPLLFNFKDSQIALTHSGNLTNAETLRNDLEAVGGIFRSNSDTEILMHLIRRSRKKTFLDRLKEALREVKGGFSYLLLTEDAMYAALDPNGFRPLVIGRMRNGAYVAAAETCALDAVGATFIREVMPGEIVIIDQYGLRSEPFTKDTQKSICAMEYIYFARPDSNISGVNVHAARKNMGRALAKEAPVDADMVIGVPNSSLSAASGYAEGLGIPYEMGLIKNQYVHRTFIQPTQELRDQGVRMKLSAVRGVVEGKKVALVDDSIVRGTTSRHLVDLLRDAGAAEVHVRITAPPFAHPSYYGADAQTPDKLIAASLTVPEIRDYLGADSLEYLSEDGLIDAIGVDSDQRFGGLCVAYFNGAYPAPLHDYEQAYQASLEAPKRAL